MAKFIVVDDHPLARLAIRLLLEKEGHTVVAETDEGENIAGLVRKHAAEAIVMDIDLPGINGIEAILALRAGRIGIPVIVMSGKNADYYTEQSMKAGANGFISKQNNLTDLSSAVTAVFSGYGYFPLRMNQSYASASPNPDSERLRMLSRREFEVLRNLSSGMEIHDIASRMQVSNKTVSTYKARLMAKLTLKNQWELLEFARRNDIN